jgi:SAM-dependent methyltransferase
MPAYFVDHDIHLQPGAYPNDPLSGPVYEVGAAIYNSRPDYDNQPERLFATGLPEDPANPPKAVLDLGCGTGKSTWYIADRFLPEGAEIHAVDLAAPMCKYAHKRNEELGLPIHVRQANSADLPYADASFDLVTAKILFHEIPRDVARATIREALRVLRPGGFFVIGDIKGYRHADAFMRMAGDWQVRHNGEPFWRETLTMDFVQEMREAGFGEVQDGPNPADKLGGFPWLTVGRKAR